MFGKHLVDGGFLTDAQLLQALEEQSNTRSSVGRLAFELDIMDLDQVVKVIAAQETGELRFCAQAVELGFMTDAQRLELLDAQERTRPPLGQIIVSMGLIGAEIVERELEAYHAENPEGSP